MERIDYDLMEALQKKIPQEIVRSLRAMEEQRQKNTNNPFYEYYDPHDFEQDRGANALKCFRWAIEDRYIDGAFLLFDQKRATYVQKDLRSRLHQDVGPAELKWFEKFAKVFEYNLNGVCELWDAIVLEKNGVLEEKHLQNIHTCVSTAMEMVEPYEQKQKVLHAIKHERQNNTHVVQIKKM